MLWTAAGAVTLGFLIALELTARHYGLPGPLTTQVKEVVFPPKSGFLLYGAMALMMVVLTRRERFLAAGVALGIDAVLLLARWATGTGLHGGHPFGNGALWVVLGCGVIALTRRTGPERLLLLKGVGLALLLVAGRKTGDTWLLITAKARPLVLDPYLAVADRALGDPSWVAGRMLKATGPLGAHFLDLVYGQLAVAAVVVSLYGLRNVAAERRFPRHHLVRTFLVIGLLGPGIYMIFPVVGPIFAYGTGIDHWQPDGLWTHTPATEHWMVGDFWPNTPPPLTDPHAIPFDELTPRNCMPSLHTAWAAAIFIHSRRGPRVLRWAGTFWLIATLAATLGFGWHYGTDLVAGVVFTLTIEAALRAQARGWDRSATHLVTYGTAIFTALLLSYRYIPMDMALRPWLYGPLILLAMGSVIYGYLRTTRAWERRDISLPTQRQPEPEPAPARAT
ncbi:phosphatase PAP2 family protein [Streptomyces justiciae]|uniref:Phosphatase PAP2 family protein n=1 Tax=Streptomyces justiciae TaxID=2780140 RepID=A0ABU3LVD1_9ACTN|nr:phosphatase PAP2 family protein [Streptomyces justiciae]MDT7842508.1 phosphatase PAP2 family protein [Streptomyces justiciae]